MSAVWIQSFRVGPAVSSAGNSRTYTIEELEQVAENYDPKLHEAPLTIGHKMADSAPAFGWVKDAKVENGSLYLLVEPTEVAEDLVNEGHYKKVSCGFYHPDDPHNPTPGQWYLNHLALLGATPPAVKGLENFQFSESYESNQGDPMMNAQEAAITEETVELKPIEEEELEVLLAEVSTANPEMSRMLRKFGDSLLGSTLVVPLYGGEKYEDDELSNYFSCLAPLEQESLYNGPLRMASGNYLMVNNGEIGGAKIVGQSKHNNYSILYTDRKPKATMRYEDPEEVEARIEEELRALENKVEENPDMLDPETTDEEMELEEEELEEEELEEEELEESPESVVVNPVENPVEEEEKEEEEEEEEERPPLKYSESAELKKLIEENRRYKREAVKREIDSFYAAGVITEGLFPSEKLTEMAFYFSEMGTSNFSESVGITPYEGLMSLLRALKPVVTFSEVIPQHKPQPKPKSKLKLPKNSNVSPATSELYEAAVAYSEENKVSFIEALQIVTQSNNQRR